MKKIWRVLICLTLIFHRKIDGRATGSKSAQGRHRGCAACGIVLRRAQHPAAAQEAAASLRARLGMPIRALLAHLQPGNQAGSLAVA